MRKYIYLSLIILIIYFQGVIVMSIDNAWIELLVLPIVCGCSAGWLYSKALKECRKETREMILLALEQMLKDAEEEIEKNNEQSKETME